MNITARNIRGEGISELCMNCSCMLTNQGTLSQAKLKNKVELTLNGALKLFQITILSK